MVCRWASDFAGKEVYERIKRGHRAGVTAVGGDRMRKVGNWQVAKLILIAGLAASMIHAAQAADLPTKAPSPDTVSSCFASAANYFETSPVECPLTWNGITLYGAIDTGAGYQAHGVPFNAYYPNGVEELISKNSNGWRYSLLPNGLGQSHVGVKGDEPIANDWSLIFNLQTGFDPYSLQLANGPKSLVQNNLNSLDVQSANGDSSRAGQIFNTIAYGGVSNPVFGTLTAGRQDSLNRVAMSVYDAMLGAPAFSLVGTSNTAAGTGDTEDARFNTSVQYSNHIGPFRFAALYQFGGYSQGNGSNGAIEGQIGGDLGGFSFDAVASKVRDAVSLSNYAQFPLPAGVSVDNLKATLSNNTSGVIMLRYKYRIVTFYGGFEQIQFQNPSDTYPQGFTTLGGYTVLPGAVNSTQYDIAKILRVSWLGVRVAVRDDLDVAAAVYHYWQNNFNTDTCTNGGLSSSKCAGTLDAASVMVDYRITKRLDGYAGVMWSQVTGGQASGYLNSLNIAPTVGLRFQF
jgi:predicted porin